MKNFIIISGSSGSGKTTLLELLSRDLNIEISVSYTTRNKRKYEIDGVHYNFINKEQFEKMIEENLFLEHEDDHGDGYGTALSSLEQYIDNNKHLFFWYFFHLWSLQSYILTVLTCPDGWKSIASGLIFKKSYLKQPYCPGINLRISKLKSKLLHVVYFLRY